MDVTPFGFLREAGRRWRDSRIARANLGKYIILFASSIHIGWALLLWATPAAEGATPVHILSVVFGGPVRTAVVLLIVASAALAFPFIRYTVSRPTLALMLIPQQAVLIMSALAGARAAWIGHYSDGVPRPWAFILADQLPVILAAVLYTTAVLEAAFADEDS